MNCEGTTKEMCTGISKDIIAETHDEISEAAPGNIAPSASEDIIHQQLENKLQFSKTSDVIPVVTFETIRGRHCA